MSAPWRLSLGTLLGLFAGVSVFGCSDSTDVLPAGEVDAGLDGSLDADVHGGADASPDVSQSCPSGDGFYCGDASLGQEPGSLYSCSGGVYDVSSDCGGLGCQINGVGQSDACIQGEAGVDAGEDATVDAEVDAGEDVTVDAEVDAGEDATVDAEVDAGEDATVDVEVDAGEDAAVDVEVDAGEDAAVDAGADAGEDATVDAGVDAAPDSGIIYGTPGQSCNGMTGTECQGKSCCSNILVPGGTFPMGRSASGTDACPSGMLCFSAEQPEHHATVSDFYLDEYEVTVGRFRKFVEQYDGTAPPDGAAAHPLIAGTGWQSVWNTNLASTQATLINNVKCSLAYQTWRDTPSGTEVLPINCVNWYEAFAFCAWDGARLPTEAEWEYTAAGGNENRLYPWGSATPNNTLDSYSCLYAGTSSCAFEDIAAVGALPGGAGRWGHKDLGGNMSEWAFDWYDPTWYSGAGNTCVNCANVMSNSTRMRRGGDFYVDANAKGLRAAYRNSLFPTYRSFSFGIRCARTP